MSSPRGKEIETEGEAIKTETNRRNKERERKRKRKREKAAELSTLKPHQPSEKPKPKRARTKDTHAKHNPSSKILVLFSLFFFFPSQSFLLSVCKKWSKSRLPSSEKLVA